LQFLTLRQPDKLELLTDFTPLIWTLEDIDVLSGGLVVSEDLGHVGNLAVADLGKSKRISIDKVKNGEDAFG